MARDAARTDSPKNDDHEQAVPLSDVLGMEWCPRRALGPGRDEQFDRQEHAPGKRPQLWHHNE